MATDSEELAQLVSEAEELARAAGQRPGSAHLLLAIFLFDNRADALLAERGCREDRVLEALAAHAGAEPPEAWAGTLQRARQLADDCGQREADSLHLLLALSRSTRSRAAAALERAATPVSSLRTAALGFLTGGQPVRKKPTSAQLPAVPIAPPAPTREVAPPAPPAPDAPPQRSSRLPPVPSLSRLGSGAPAPQVQASSMSGAPRTAVTEYPPPVAREQAPPPAPDGKEKPSELEQEKAPPRQPVAAPREAPRQAPRQAEGPAREPAPSRWELDPRHYPFLTTHGRNLSLAAVRGQLDEALGRDGEVEEVLDILGKRRANNPLLVGEPGVGKTAIVEGLARRLVQLSTGQPALAEGEAGAFDRILVELDVGNLVAGTALRGSFSERLIGIKDEVKKAEGRVVVFIDELHMLMGAGATGDGPQDAANELKAALARGEFPCIGATTHDEFRKHIQGDPALERRFVAVLVREPSVRQTRSILTGAALRYQEHHQVRFLDEALEAACALSARYVRDRFLPDKAFAAIDLAGSRARREGRGEVTRDDVARAVARMAGLPEERLLQPDGERFLTLERRLAERIVGHEVAVQSLARVLRRNHAGFAGQRPLGSFLLLGPSGVGKTETAKVLAEELFPSAGGTGGSGALIRIDLSEFSEAHSVSRLIGAGPGYVGYGEGGLLTEPVRRRPACVVLFDEAEKAHPAALQLLLQVLDEGQLTDGRGRRIDFTASVIALTTNAGAEAFGSNAGRPAGFAADRSDPADRPPVDHLAKTLPPQPAVHPQAARALELSRAAFAPELWGRLDERLVFAPLSREEVARIAQLQLAESSRRLWDERRISFRTGPGLVDYLVGAGGWQPALGARPMRQTIERLVESPLADEILAGRVHSGERLLAVAGPRGVEFRAEPAPR